MRNVKRLSVVAIMLFLLQILSPSLSVFKDVHAEGITESKADEEVKIEFVQQEAEVVTWKIRVNEVAEEHDEMHLAITVDEAQEIHTIETAMTDETTIEKPTTNYELHLSPGETANDIIIQTEIITDETTAIRMDVTATYDEEVFQSYAEVSVKALEKEPNAPKEDETREDTAAEPDVGAKEQEVTLTDEPPITINETKAEEMEATKNTVYTTTMEYDETSYSKDVRNYNGIIFGDHYINGGDNEGATAVGGNIVIEGAFDYGAAEVESNHIIGDSPLPRDTPGLLLRGKVTGSGSGIGVYNGVVMEENADTHGQIDVKSGAHVFVPQTELDMVFAGFRTYMENHYTDLNSFVTGAPSVDANGFGTKSFHEEVFHESDKNDRVLVVHLVGNTLSFGDLNFPDLDAYDKVIIKADATTVKFSNGSFFYDGTIINTSAPYGTEPNFQKVASKLTWLFPNATKIDSNGYGVIGTIVAPDANYTGNGGSLNGQLFINDLRNYGGFELHQFRNKVEVPAYGKLQVIKVDAADETLLLAGAKFQIVNEQDEVIDEFITDENGEGLSIDLLVGDYTLVEVEAPEGYEILESAFSISIVEDEIVTKVIENTKTPEPQGQIKILKTDSEVETVVLQGAVFELRNKAGEVVGQLTTDENGEATSEKLPVGEYILEEVEAPTDYELLTETISVTVKDDEVTEIVIKNEKTPDPLGEIKLIKVDAADHDTVLAGARFTLTDETGKEIATEQTNNHGEIVFQDLVLGTYYVTEIEAPDGYRLLSSPIELVLTKENHQIERVIENTKIDWEIPETGGIGTLGFYGVGLLFILTAGWFAFRKRKA